MPSNKHLDTGKYSSCDYCHICSGDVIEKIEMRGACITYGREEKYIQSFGGEIDNLEEKCTCEDNIKMDLEEMECGCMD
jgi:hypothetical protein